MHTTVHPSPLDEAQPVHEGKPFFDLTLTLLRSVRDHDLDTLAELCDDDFGIVDIDPSGGNVPIRTRTEWEHWFRGLFAQLDTLGADTDSQVLAYDAVAGRDLGYSVVEFRQTLSVGEHTPTFDCITTIVWKQTPSGWREARWHGSVIAQQVPDELTSLT